jgi:hypothetical protein
LDVVFHEDQNANSKHAAKIDVIRVHRVYEELNFAQYLGF